MRILLTPHCRKIAQSVGFDDNTSRGYMNSYPDGIRHMFDEFDDPMKRRNKKHRDKKKKSRKRGLPMPDSISPGNIVYQTGLRTPSLGDEMPKSPL